MGEEAYQIKDYFQDKALAFAGTLNPKCKLACNEDEMYSTESLKLEIYNPEDNIQVTTFFMKSTPQKMYIFMIHYLLKNNGNNRICKFIHSFLLGGIKNGVTGQKYLSTVFL